MQDVVANVEIKIKMAGSCSVTSGAFVVTSETRERFGISATSLTLTSKGHELSVEMNTDLLMTALTNGGLTADDLRVFADKMDMIPSSPVCPEHNAVMTFGRYSDNPLYEDAHTEFKGHFYYCNNCVDEVTAR